MVFLSGTFPAHADTVTTDDGRTWTGVVLGKTDTHLKLDLGFDVASLELSRIAGVKISRGAEKEEVRRAVEAKRRRRDQALARRAGGAKEAPLVNEGGHVFVDAVLNGRAKARFLLDTGSTITILTPEAAERAGLSVGDGAREAQVVTTDGRKHTVKMFTLDSLSVGGAEVRRVDVAVIDSKAQPLYGDGLLGVSYLSKFDFKIDYRRGKLVLDPNGRAGSYGLDRAL